jgi:hypothetical protein
MPLTGSPIRTLRPRGSFDADVEYRALDVVFWDGSSYVALCDAPGKCLSTERGLIGPRGEPAPRITGWRVDHAAYTAVPLLSDGSEGASLELRSMFKQFLDEVAPRA